MEAVAVVDYPLRELLLNVAGDAGTHDEVADEGAEALVEGIGCDDSHFVGLSAHHDIPVSPGVEEEVRVNELDKELGLRVVLVDGLGGEECKDVILLGVSRELVAEDEDPILLDVGHLHHLLSEDVPHDVVQTLLVLRVREHCQHLLRGLVVLDYYHLHVLLHVVVRVEEFLQELRKCVRRDIPN